MALSTAPNQGAEHCVHRLGLRGRGCLRSTRLVAGGGTGASTNSTKLLSTYNSTEFGVPTSSNPPKYSWLGAGEFPTELSSGVIAMGARSYVPEIGRFLQPDPQPGGSANAYAYTYG